MIKNKYRTIEGQDTGHIRILDEKYTGVAVSIGKVSIDNSSNEETATLKYEYDIIDVPKNIEIDVSFDTLVGDIIIDILETKLEDSPDSLRFNESED
jgi:ABC-type transporter Mla subunit MlaD